jgi:hypothetical protein
MFPTYFSVDNVAYGKTTASSGDANTNSASTKAVDGSRDGATANKKCALVNKKSSRTWLSIDLKTVKHIERVVIATRKEDRELEIERDPKVTSIVARQVHATFA